MESRGSALVALSDRRDLKVASLRRTQDEIRPPGSEMKSCTRDLQSARVPRALVLLFLAVALAFLYLRTFLLPGTPLVASGDELYFFAHANRILQGQVPFRDFFAFVMPGTDLLYASAFRLFGVHAWLAQAFVIFLGFTVACLVIWISRYVLSGPSVLLPGLLFLVLDFNSALDATHHWYSTLIVMAAAASLLGGRSFRRILTAGALCGVATIFTQTRGTLGLIAIAIFLVSVAREKTKETHLSQIIALAVPFAAVVASVLGYYTHQAGLRSLLYALGYFAVKFIPTLPAYTLQAYFLQVPPHKTFSDLVHWISFVFIHLLVPFVYLFGLLRLLREKNTMGRRLWESLLLINLIGIALFASVMTGPTYHRLCMAAPPAIIVCVWFFSGSKLVDQSMRILLWSMALALVLFLPIRRQLHWRAYLDLPTDRTAFVDPSDYEKTKWFSGQTHAGETFFSDLQLSFALALDNPAPLDCVTPYEFTRPEQVDAVVRALADRRTPLIFLYPELYTPREAGDNLAPFRRYVYQNYHLAKVYPSGQVWARN